MSKASHNGSEVFEPQQTLAEHPRPSDSEYLRQMGGALRAARARRGMSRKMLATQSAVSERFLAQLEAGTGNASVLILRQISHALNIPVDQMLPGYEERSGELRHAIELLQRLGPTQLAQAKKFLSEQFGATNHESDRRQRIALIGLRGAGKSTIGKLLGRRLSVPFFELDGLIEQTSGVSLSMIFDLYGQSGFRRFEHRCLADLLKAEKRFVVATGGSLVSEASTYEDLLQSCYTIWLRATPHEHMTRVIAQGDMRPMANNPEAMADLERILLEREELYKRADASVNTSGKSAEEVLGECLGSIEPVHENRE